MFFLDKYFHVKKLKYLKLPMDYNHIIDDLQNNIEILIMAYDYNKEIL